MEAVDKGSSGKGEFFTVNLNQIDEMVKLGAGAEEVMSFVILARGVNRRRRTCFSTHGANSIANRTGMSYRRAQASLDWLVEKGFIQTAPDNSNETNKAKRAKWLLVEDADLTDVYQQLLQKRGWMPRCCCYTYTDTTICRIVAALIQGRESTGNG